MNGKRSFADDCRTSGQHILTEITFDDTGKRQVYAGRNEKLLLMKKSCPCGKRNNIPSGSVWAPVK